MSSKLRLGLFSIMYLPFAAVEIVASINTSTFGELNLAGWIAGILGIVVCFPWMLLGFWILEKLSLNPNDYLGAISIISVIINLIIIMCFDGVRYRGKHYVDQA